MLKQRQLALSDPAEWLGDWHPLAEQLGSAEGLVELSSLSSLLRHPPVVNPATLRSFLGDYRANILVPLELPAIRTAHGHACRNEIRELIAFDRQLAAHDLLREFATPSRRVGQFQLQKLRPLRDERGVQRYLQAVLSGEASGWHTLVYGLTLAVYSLPLRQGLLGYAHQTLRSFIYSAARTLHFSEAECSGFFDEAIASLPSAIEELLRTESLAAGSLSG
jgi:urease accessory protein UreF